MLRRLLPMILLCSLSASASEEKTIESFSPQMMLTVEARYAFLIAGGATTFAYKMHEHFALVFIGAVDYVGWPGEGLLRASLGFGGRFFLTAPAFNSGWIVQPWIEGGLAQDLKTGDQGVVLTPSLVFGYAWVWQQGFTLGLSGGLQYVFVTNNLFNPPIGLSGIVPLAQISLGYVW